MQADSLPQAIAVLAPSAVEAGQIVDGLVERVLGPDADLELSVVRLDAAAIAPAELQGHLANVSLLAGERVVIIRDPHRWTAAEQRELLQLLRALPAGVTVILVVAGEDATRRQPLHSDLMAYLNAHGLIERRRKMTRQNVEDWATSLARQHGVGISPEAVAELVARTGGDADRIASEVGKLAAYVGEGAQVELEHVEQLVPRTVTGSVFALLDAIGEGNVNRACTLVREFIPQSGQDEAVAHLLYMLARHYRLLWQALEIQRAGYRLDELEEVPEELVGKLPADPNVVAAVAGRRWMARKLSGQASSHTPASIVRSMREIYLADISLKGLVERRLSAEVVAEMLVAELCRLVPRRGVWA